MSALLQTPAGFLVDRIGARVDADRRPDPERRRASASPPCCRATGSSSSAYALLGVANTVYHPADYSILSAAIDGKRIGKAFSIHTFAGYLGFGVTPAMVLAAAALWGWHGAFLFAAVLSFAAALLLIVAGSVLPRAVASADGQAGQERRQGRARPAAERARSCATCCSSSASPWPMAASRPSRWWRWARSTARRRRSPISALSGFLLFSAGRRAAGRHHRRPHAAPRAGRGDGLCLHLDHGDAAGLGRTCRRPC